MDLMVDKSQIYVNNLFICNYQVPFSSIMSQPHCSFVTVKLMIIMLLSLGIGHTASAQTSIMPDISPTYISKLVTYAQENYPKVKALDHKLKATHMAVNKSKLAWFDLVSFNYLYSPTNSITLVSPSLFNGYQIGFNANVGNLLGKVGSTRILKEELHIVEEDIAEYNLRLKAEVTQRYINYVVRQAVLSSKSKTAVETESLVKQVQYKFEKSEETLENYSRIINNYYAAIQSKLEAEGELLKAKSAIEELLGTPLESIK